jgi:phenylacetate-CoA ligase
MTNCPDYEGLSRTALETALRDVPAYAAWRARDPGPAAPIDARYAALPVLTKRELREHFPLGFIPAGRDLHTALAQGHVEYAQTSGSTDDQVTLVFHAPWWEASERAAWQLNAHAQRIATGTHREVVLASPRCVGPGFAEHDLSTAARTLGRHLYLNQKINPATWTAADIRRMAEELNAYAPVAMEGDPAYLAQFARRLDEAGLAVHQPELIFLTYSFPSRLYRRQIRRAFRAPIASSYGSTETGHVFMECEAGRLHQNTAHCRVDFEPWPPRYGGPALGRMLVTVFHNPWFAVLRFDIGDVARRDDRGPCPCGRCDGLTLAAIEGRIKDVTFTPDGQAVTVDQLDLALSAVEGLHGYQLDHLAPTRYHLRILADGAAGKPVTAAATDALRKIYGLAAGIEVEAAPALQHEASGKFRFARAHFPVDPETLWNHA